MKSNVSGRVVPQPPGSSGCRPQNIFYNHLGLHHHSNHQHHQQQQHQQQHHHQQNLAYHHPQHQNQQHHHQNYAMLQCFSQHTSNGWAGIPLISTAVSSNRRQRKPTVNTAHRSPPSISCSNSLHIYNSNRDPHNNEYDMSRLAMHAQGAPLLLTGSYNRNRLNGGSSSRQIRSLNPNSSEGYPCTYKPSGQHSLHQKSKENNNSGPIGGTNAQSEAAAACLPRIIKPRKRRKKDRKPLPTTTSNFVKMDNEPETTVILRRGGGPTNFIEQQQQQHPHPHQMLGFEFETQCNLKKDEPPMDVQQDPTTGSVCFCRQCDPLSRIWAFPLRRSHSDNSSDTTEFERATKNVGVIGSNRSNQMNLIKNTHTGNLSDSSDSGYGDILSGIHIGDDFFNSNSYLQLQKLPTDLLLSPTAESLLTESINEISRKLMETCDIKGASSVGGGSSSPSSSSSSDSCSVFSDSGISSATSSNHPSGDELIFNFENLSINSTEHPSLLFPTNDPIFDCFSADINNNNITTVGNGGGSPRIDPQLFNCLDLLWGSQTSPPSSSSRHTDGPKQSTSSTTSHSSSSSSFYRHTVASM